MNDPRPDLTGLLRYQRPSAFHVWLDPLSPANELLLPYLQLDGHTNGGRPWRFRGHDDVALRLLPDPEDEMSGTAARCILTVRAWAVQREGKNSLIPMDYDLPWAYFGDMLRDISSVRGIGLPHLVSLAGREGEWLGDWVAEYRDSPEVFEAIDAERAAAQAAGVVEVPSITVGTKRFDASTMPDDIADQITQLLDARD